MSNVIYLAIIGILLIILFLTLREEKQTRPKTYYAVEEYWKGPERREFKRLSKVLELEYAYFTPNHKETTPQGVRKQGVGQNISWGGIQLLLPEKLKEGTQLSLDIQLEKNRPSIRAIGEVIWMQEATDMPQPDGSRVFRTGMRFVDFSSKAQDRLVKFLYEEGVSSSGH